MGILWNSRPSGRGEDGGEPTAPPRSDDTVPPPLRTRDAAATAAATAAGPSSPSSRDGEGDWPAGRLASTFEDDSVEDPAGPDPASASAGRDMSCSSAFSMAMDCTSFAGQWRAVYRTGTLQRCSEEWGDFWACMRFRARLGQAKEEAFREYHRDKEREKYDGRPSSEDVWAPRRHVVRRGAFLTHPMPSAEMADEEWQQEDIRHRKAIRTRLGLPPEEVHSWGVKRGQ